MGRGEQGLCAVPSDLLPYLLPLFLSCAGMGKGLWGLRLRFEARHEHESGDES